MNELRPRIAIDLVPIHAGRGGAGGGIWSYASALVNELDRLAPRDLEIVCLTRSDQSLAASGGITRELFDVDTRSPMRRLDWVHRELPLWCKRNRIAVLHKLATEVPWWTGQTRLVTTVQDFMTEYYLEQLDSATAGRSLRSRLQARYFGGATGRCFERSAALLVTTNVVSAEARRRFPDAAGRLRTVPLGVDHDIIRGSVSEPAPVPVATPLSLLCLGAFLPHKGQLLAVAAFERLLQTTPQLTSGATLTLRGHPADEAWYAVVRSAAAASPAASSIRFANYESDSSVPARLAGVDMLLQLSAYEGFGLPPLEAQAAGIPVVCADLPVFREVLGDGAIFVRRDDSASVAAAIASLATDHALRAALVARGRANAAHFSWARTASETLSVYREVATGELETRNAKE